MATILTVHGTFSTGPETGEKWFQKGNPFEVGLRELIEAENGELTFQPFIWDGENSETSRRAAGTVLLAKMQALEEQGEPYVLIGHSHGGSVIASALMESAAHKSPLEHLKCWLTVGTPFIETTKVWSLFNRLGVLGKSIYVTMLTGIILYVMTQNMFQDAKWELKELFDELGWILLVLVPFILFYSVNIYLSDKKLKLYNKSAIKVAEQFFWPRWRSLWHKNDEAVQSLRALKSIKAEIFRSQFAVPLLSLPASFIFPLLLILAVNSPGAMQYLYQKATNSFAYKSYNPTWMGPEWENITIDENNKLVGDGRLVHINARFLVDFLRHTFDRPFKLTEQFNKLKSQDELKSQGEPRSLEFYLTMLGCVLLLGAVGIGISYLIVFAWTMFAKLLSDLISRAMNPITTQQIRAMGFGSDTRTDRAVNVDVRPMWLGKSHNHLPDSLCEEMQASSDAAVSKVVPKFRDALGRLLGATGKERSDMLSSYLTWEELIHTSYFNNPKFCKLVALSLTEAREFRATEALKLDPDYQLISTWHSELFPK